MRVRLLRFKDNVRTLIEDSVSIAPLTGGARTHAYVQSDTVLNRLRILLVASLV